MNIVILAGNVGKDAETVTFSNGSSICKFNLATNTSWTDKQTGEKKERVEWHSIVVSQPKMVEVATKYIKKGMKISVQGEIRYTSKEENGVKTYYTQIQCERFEFLSAAKTSSPEPGNSEVTAEVGDDLPF